jgi:phosphoribosylamine-glycine ligase
MVAEGTPFRGVLFAGLMIKDGRVRPIDRRPLHAVAACGL